MSNTPKLTDECKKLLDNGWIIVLHANALGSYSANAVSVKHIRVDKFMMALDRLDPDPDCEHDDSFSIVNGYCETDDFEPSQALYRLTEKVYGNIA